MVLAMNKLTGEVDEDYKKYHYTFYEEKKLKINKIDFTPFITSLK